MGHQPNPTGRSSPGVEARAAPACDGSNDWARGRIASALALVMLLVATALLSASLVRGGGRALVLRSAQLDRAVEPTIDHRSPSVLPIQKHPAAVAARSATNHAEQPVISPQADRADDQRVCAGEGAADPLPDVACTDDGSLESGRAVDHDVAGCDDEAMPPRVSGPGLRININTAGESELSLLPGIGPAMSARIIADREANGPFVRIEDLDRVRGIGPRTLERLRDLITTGNDAVAGDRDHRIDRANTPERDAARIDLNSATLDQFQTLPGIGPALAARIIQDRRARGPFRTVDELQRVRGIGPATVERLRDRVMVRPTRQRE